MRARVKDAVQKVLELREEFSKSELEEALDLIQRHRLLEEEKRQEGRRSSPSAGEAKRVKPLSDSVSKVVMQLEESDPEKYMILSRFDKLVRSGEVLSRMSDIRSTGQAIEKNFEGGKAKREAIPRLMEVLSRLPLEQLDATLMKIMREEEQRGEKGEDYRKLASFLIGREADR